jgi:hypothetical protein
METFTLTETTKDSIEQIEAEDEISELKKTNIEYKFPKRMRLLKMRTKQCLSRECSFIYLR